MLSFRWSLIGYMGLCSILGREMCHRLDGRSLGLESVGMVFGRCDWDRFSNARFCHIICEDIKTKLANYFE